MPRNTGRFIIFALAATSVIVAIAQQPGTAKKDPTCEEVFKNITVFKGVPASDLIPSMEFMAASLKMECSDCHDPKDYSKDTHAKEAARSMVTMQRDINARHFNNRNQVTCMTCHRGSEHPVGTPLPPEVKIRHTKLDNPPKPEDLLAKSMATVGKASAPIVRVGTLTAENDVTHKVETLPVTFTQTESKFILDSPTRKLASDGSKIYWSGYPMDGEGAAVFGRFGRSWRGDSAFAGLDKLTVTGKETLGKTDVIVVRGTRASTDSTEELSFDAKSGLLVRMVNIKRSSLGNVVSSFDYSNFKTVGGAKVPMKVSMTFAGGQQWVMDFKSAKADANVKDADFTPVPPKQN